MGGGSGTSRRLRSLEQAGGADAELGEYLPEVVGDGRRADEQLRGDLGIRGTLAGQAGDVRFPGGKHVPALRGLLGGALASRAQLGSCPFGERHGAGRDEDRVRGAELTAGIALALLTAQPLAVQQVSAGQLKAQAIASEAVDRLPVEIFSRLVAGQQRT